MDPLGSGSPQEGKEAGGGDASVVLRPITAEDMEFLYRVYASTREEELAQVSWTPEQKEAFLRQQFGAQHAHYQEYYHDADFQVILKEGVPVGRLYVARWKNDIRIVDIALLPEHRGGGIGTRLIRDLFAEGDGSGRRVSIHVEVYNPARKLYERLGFVQTDDRGVYVFMERPPAAEAGVR